MQKPGHQLHAHGCALEGLEVRAARGGVRPHGRPQHLRHGLAGAAVHTPQVDEKREAPQRLHQHRGEGRRKDDPGGQAVGAGVQGLCEPAAEASDLPYGLIDRAEAVRAVEGHAPHIGRKPLLVPAHAGNGLDLRDDILVFIDGIPEEVHQCLRPLSAGDRNAAVRKGHDVGSLGYPAHGYYDLRPWSAV